jgi:hypothetical protein
MRAKDVPLLPLHLPPLLIAPVAFALLRHLLRLATTVGSERATREMPFRTVTDLDVQTLRTMTAAYDAVVARLNMKSDDPRTGPLAAKIVMLARTGERDVGKLIEQALIGLA